jgi:hypothetical protein
MLQSQVKVRLYSKKDLPFILLFLIIFLWMFKEFFFTDGVFFERDSTLLEVPTRKICAQLLREGNFALWTDAHGNGQPFLANPKNAVFYPTTLLYLVLPLFTAFKLHYLVHVLLGWIGLYYLCKSYSLSLKASFMGASFFIFSGIYLSSFEFYNHIASLAWMFWILLVLGRDSKSALKKLVSLAILWSLLILSGTPHVIVLAIVFSLLQSAFAPEGGKRKIILALTSLAIAALICAAQLLPSFELTRQADREAVNMSEWPLELVQLANLAFPDILGNDRTPGHAEFWGRHLFDRQSPLYYSLYVGFGALLLFIIGLKKPWDRRRWFLLTAFVLFFLLSSGKYLPFYPLLKSIPYFSTIRYPVKFLTGSLLSLCLLAAIGFDAMLAEREPAKRRLPAGIIAAVTGLVLFFIFRGRLVALLRDLFVMDDLQSVRDLAHSLFYGFLAFAVFLGLYYTLTRLPAKKALLSWMFLALAVFDIASVNKSINPVAPASAFSGPSILGALPAPSRVYRNAYIPEELKKTERDLFKIQRYQRRTLYPYTGMGEGIDYIYNNDFYGLYSREYNRLLEIVKKSSDEDLEKFLNEARCDYAIIPKLPKKAGVGAVIVEGFPFDFRKMDRPTSPVFLVRRTVRVRTLEEKVGVFLGKKFDPEETALVENDVELNNSGPTDPPDAVVLTKQNQGEFQARVKASLETIGVFPGNYAKGWRASIDGKPARVFKVNFSSKGVLFSPGEHEITLKYFPKSFQAGLMISLFSIIALAVILVFARVFRRAGLRLFRRSEASKRAKI